jgi:hypothetical protein
MPATRCLPRQTPPQPPLPPNPPSHRHHRHNRCPAALRGCQQQHKQQRKRKQLLWKQRGLKIRGKAGVKVWQRPCAESPCCSKPPLPLAVEVVVKSAGATCFSLQRSLCGRSLLRRHGLRRGRLGMVLLGRWCLGSHGRRGCLSPKTPCEVGGRGLCVFGSGGEGMGDGRGGGGGGHAWEVAREDDFVL